MAMTDEGLSVSAAPVEEWGSGERSEPAEFPR